MKKIYLALLTIFAMNVSAWGSQLFLKGEFLYWEPHEDGLTYLRYMPAYPIATGYSGQLQYATPHFRWDPGFRLAVGYSDPCQNWDSSLTWTYLYCKATSNVSAPPLAGGLSYMLDKRDMVIQTTPDVDFVDSFTANASWKVNYNVIDWEFAMPYCIYQRLTFIPIAGLRGAFIDQSFRDSVLTLNGPFLTYRDESIINNYKAGGLRAGIGFVFDGCYGFGLFGKTSGSLLYGQFHVKDQILSNASRIIGNSDTYFNRVRPNIEANIGIQWKTNFCSSSQELLFQFGYDLVYWFDQNQIPGQIQPEITNSSALSFQGINVSASYAF